MSEARSVTEFDRRPELGKYELLEEVGHGGMASVFRAKDRRLGREVAVKIIHRHLRDNPEVAARFTAEARAVAKLRHPNIVEVYDVSDEAESERYLVVELVRGITLRKLLADQGHLPAEIAAIIGVLIADALEHAHQQGVVHRDVKPENVLVAQALGDSGDRVSSVDALIKITDFGIAKILDAQGVTSTGQVLGSPAHMSPEQIEGGDVSARSDVFGLGVLLYECMVGQLPFDGRNPAQVLRRVLEGSYLPAERARATVGHGLSRIVDRALAHDAADRHASAAELEKDLDRELVRMGFTEPERELADFLRAPVEYLGGYEARMVERLAELGRVAQRARNIPEAAHCFNRALAFRPNDPELLRWVTGLNRVTRWRARARKAAVLAGVAALVTGAAILAMPLFQTLRHADRPTPAAAPSPVPSTQVNTAPSASLASVSDLPSARPRPEAPPVLHPPIRPATPPTRTAEKRTRIVQILIPGAPAGAVTVDGQQVGQHGAKTDLVVGQTYTFGFVPPNPECCVGSQRVVTIPEGDGTFTVQGSITLRQAVIRATGAPDNSSLSCGMWGHAVTPGAVSVTLDYPEEATGRCTLIPPPSTGIEVRTRPVTIRPGQVIDLWPKAP